ncbi:MAG: RagB/SusD family nutrient uptake outer membrane protein [Bacteroidetes bacterium]|nr:MAG: RagB/SusD family nutrient uptake outer membrane protein [Bacteroidota bacterium]TAF93915.1 MAG: RagB/SusD family nutrient uptake outer membrane protein [Bacteroidota bacterium]
MKIYKKFLLAAVLGSSLVACRRDTVDAVTPIDQIPATQAIQNMQDVVNGLNGVYGSLGVRRASHVSAYITDEVRLGVGGEYRNVGNILFNWQFVSDTQDWRDGENGGAWTNLYTVIDRANRLVELMVPVPTPTAAEVALKEQIRGEMIAIRAFCHLELLRWYASTPQYTPNALGVPVQTTFVRTPGSFRPTRATQQEVINQVNLDLALARTLIPATFTDNGRLTRNAVIALQVRAAEHTRNWNEVITRANEIITAQPISNIANYPAIWTTRTLTANQSTEVVWKYNIQLSNLGFAVGSLFQDVGTGAVQASAAVKLTNLFSASDVRTSLFFRPATGPAGPRNLINKYGSVFGGNGENFQYDVKVLRTSESLLSRAEANAELNNIAAANADLALLRSNRITGYTHTNISDRAALIAAILEERYKELCYEGFRLFDLKRKGLGIQRDLGDAGGLTTIQNLPASDFRMVLPIPQQETFANPNMQQNPNY